MVIYKTLIKKAINFLIYFTFIFCNIFVSCNLKDKKLYDNTTKVTFEDGGSFKINNYFNQFEFIPLETRADNLFKKITDIKIKDDKLFVFSESPDNKVSIFSMDGHFLNVVGRNGRGPGEISFATSFDVDSCIMILDRGNRKILNFALNGKFISEIDLYRLFFNQFSLISNNKIVLFNYNPISRKKGIQNTFTPKSKLTFWEYNNSSNKIKFLANGPHLNSGLDIPFILKNFYNVYNNYLYYWGAYNDTIKRINLETFQSINFQILDFSKSKFPQNMLENSFKGNIGPEKFMKLVKKGYASIFDYFYFHDGSQLLVFNNQGKMYLGYLRTDEKELTTYNKINLDNLYPNLMINIDYVNFYPVYYDNKFSMYFCWESVSFIETFKQLKNQLKATEWDSLLKSNPSLKDAISKVTIENNPILLKVRLKY